MFVVEGKQTRLSTLRRIASLPTLRERVCDTTARPALLHPRGAHNREWHRGTHTCQARQETDTQNTAAATNKRTSRGETCLKLARNHHANPTRSCKILAGCLGSFILVEQLGADSESARSFILDNSGSRYHMYVAEDERLDGAYYRIYVKRWRERKIKYRTGKNTLRINKATLCG